MDRLHTGGSLTDIPSLGYAKNGEVCVNDRAPNVPMNSLPWFPYDKIDVSRYVGRSYLGSRVLNHNTSFGCPFACNFCAVVALSNRRWLPESAERVAGIVQHLHDRWQINGLEFHDMDFFVQESRTAEFAERLSAFAGDLIGGGAWGASTR